jgi:hypothetical protein
VPARLSALFTALLQGGGEDDGDEGDEGEEDGDEGEEEGYEEAEPGVELIIVSTPPLGCPLADTVLSATL